MTAYTKNFKLTLPAGDDYYDVNVFNRNFNKIDGVMSARGKIVASYDTVSPLKENADFVCNSENAREIIQSAVDSMYKGEELILLDGTYNIKGGDGSGINVNKEITIRGSGIQSTFIVRNGDNGLFKLTGHNVRLKDLMLCENAQGVSSKDYVVMSGEGFEIENVFFNESHYNTNNFAVLSTSGETMYCRIQNCRFYREISKKDHMMKFDKYKFSGIILGNMLSGLDNISISLKDGTSRMMTAIYGNNSTDIYVGGVKE